jgi:GNAT superfamily N-acetyltransferase
VSEAPELVRGGAELLAELEPLWLALRDHHAEIAPELGPVREDADSWARRRAQYKGWLAEGEPYILLARRGGRAVGYAFVRPFPGGGPTWTRPERGYDVETLSVAPEARGTGVGSALLERVERDAAEAGADVVDLTAVASNAGALRFYAREGFSPAFVVLRRRTRRP